MREVSKRLLNIGQDGLRLAAGMQVAGNLVQIATGLAKLAEHLTERGRIGGHTPLCTGASFADERRAGESGGGHARPVGAGEERRFFIGRDAGIDGGGALPLFGLAP